MQPWRPSHALENATVLDEYVPPVSFAYRLHDTTGDELGTLEHPAPNVEPGDVVVLADGREALVTSRVAAAPGPLAALLEVVVAPSPVIRDDAIA